MSCIMMLNAAQNVKAKPPYKCTCVYALYARSTLNVSTTAKKKCDSSSIRYAVSTFCLLWFSTFSLAIEFVLQGE